MIDRLKRILPWLALVGVLLAALLLAFGGRQRSQMLVESPETRVAADQVMAQIQSLSLQTLADPSLRTAVDQAAKADSIASVWVFAADGKINYAQSTPLQQGSAGENATRQVKGALAALPAGTLTDEQTMLILVASTIQAEGEHTDVFRYRVEPIHAVSGALLGYLALAYDVNPSISAAPSAGYILSLLGLLAGLAVYVLALVAWVYLDARQRGERAAVWAIFVLIGNLVALIAYLLARRPAEG
jgi:hypothetical protein